MAHWAKVVDGIVEEVLVAEASFFDTFVDTSPGTWIKTSYNTRGGVHYSDDAKTTPSSDQSKALRYNFAGINYHYDEEADAFYARQPWPSHTLNTSTYTWEPPIDRPVDGTDETGNYGWYWSEQAYNDDTNDPKTAGWVKKYYQNGQ